MIYIIIENHAHRLLQNGVVESTEVINDGNPNVFVLDSDDFKVLDPAKDLDMDYSDFNYIRQQLEILHSMFPTGRTGVPKSEKRENVAQDYNVEKV